MRPRHRHTPLQMPWQGIMQCIIIMMAMSLARVAAAATCHNAQSALTTLIVHISCRQLAHDPLVFGRGVRTRLVVVSSARARRTTR